MSAFGNATFDDGASDSLDERVVGVSDAARRRLLAPPQMSSVVPRLPSLPDPLARRRLHEDDAGITLRTEDDDDDDDDDDDSTFSLGNNGVEDGEYARERSEASLQQAASASSVRALGAGGASVDDSIDESVRPRTRPIILRRRLQPRVEEPDDAASMDGHNSVPNALASTVSALSGGGGGGDSLGVEILGDRDAASCPLCWEEQPHIDDSSMRTAMVERMSDFRRIIFRFERMMAGRQSDEVIFRGMLELRQGYIEKDLRRYSDNRFRPWTMDVLRRHYSPLSGHRFDIVRELDKQLADMRRQRQWIMEHAMFVVHPDSGERVFNIRAVETMTRLEREYDARPPPAALLTRRRRRRRRRYSRIIGQKSAELGKRNATLASDSNMVMQAVNAACNQDDQRHKRQRRGATALPQTSAGGSSAASSSNMYEVGGL